MPYKDIEKRREMGRNHYQRNKLEVDRKNSLRRRELKLWFHDYKSKLECNNCGENHPACLQFHHRNPSDKNDNVCIMVMQGCKKERILEEITKCDVLCANCHFKFHYDDDNSEMWNTVKIGC